VIGGKPRCELTAGDDFEDFEFLTVGNGIRDRDRRLAPHHHDGVRPEAFGAKDVLDSGRGARKLDALGAFVEPAAYSDFGRNPSSLCARRKRLKQSLRFKASPGSQAVFLPR
jgi:hypothetical protein